jgi:TonB family protein
MLPRFWPVVVLLVVPAICAGSRSNFAAPARRISLAENEKKIWRTPARNSQFNDVLRADASSRCEDTQPPEALATPNPLLPAAKDGTKDGTKVKVSFIIGIDGRVHSPLILESAGPTGDRNVLRTVRFWRYRPATCNGVPTETEGKIEFSSR